MAKYLSRMFAAPLVTALTLIWVHVASPVYGQEGEAAQQSLAGRWRFALDREDVGVDQKWFAKELTDRIELPGILQAQGYGDEISTETPWVLSLYDKNWHLRADYQQYTKPGQVKVPFVCQPQRHYLGAAWYQRDIEIPDNWKDRRVELFLERTRWETTVWIDERKIGSCNSLVAPHEFDLGQLSPGMHQLTVRIDNRMQMNYRPDAHAVSDSLGSTWNGVVGKIELRSTPLVWIEDAQVFTDETNAARIQVRIGNVTGEAGSGELSVGSTTTEAKWDAEGGKADITVPLGDDVKRWDEFHPELQTVTLRLESDGITDQREVTFGIRSFKTRGREFVINGRLTHLRGTHHGGDFPLTGYPPYDDLYWLDLFKTCREWGINHVRFHSFCPPEAAFTAADKIGIYLQPECGMWNEISPGTQIEKMLYAETDRMIQAYGNHPSFVLFSPSNEPKGHWKEALTEWIKHYRSVDSRRLYTTGTGWSLIDDPEPVADRVDYLAVHRVGLRLMRGDRGWFGRDYASSYEGVDVPNIVHENGQWCAYPDYDVIEKFTGFIQPGNYEIFRDSLADHGMLDRNKAFAWASGRFQLECYKEEVEANLRTPGLGGFQLLDLHDYTGQGTALVGLLDPFWEEKGYVTADEWRQFCNTTVPLARLRKRVFTTADRFEVPVEVYHYGPTPLQDANLSWQVVDPAGKVAAAGEWDAKTIPLGRSTPLGTVSLDLGNLAAPQAYQLRVKILSQDDTAFENSWNFWLYPEKLESKAPREVLVTQSWSEAQERLAEGGKVLFEPPPTLLDWSSPPLDRVPVFWNRLMNPNWGRMLGLWCDAQHPALAGFPTNAHCDWQWTEIVRGVRAMNLDSFPSDLQPIVQAIDDWNRNWKLGLVYECRVGSGKLVVCTIDLERDLERRPVARQLRCSLLDYMAGSHFLPTTQIEPEIMRSALFDSLVMKRLGATVQADGANPKAVIDGDPNTSWFVGPRGRRQPPQPHPHELTISFAEPVAMSGVIFMPRQNDRNHQGDIREFRLEGSDDGENWQILAESELESSFDPQTLEFEQVTSAKQLRLTVLSGFGDDPTAALAELAVIPAGNKLPGVGGAIEYQRVRSTSSDVEEGD